MTGQAILLRRADCDLVDDAASAADPLQRVGAVNHLDAIDEERIDGETVPRAIAQWCRLRNAVDRVERRTTAQCFARPRQLLPGGRERRRQSRHGINDRTADGDLLVECRIVDDIDCEWQGVDRQHGAGCGHHDTFVWINILCERRARTQ